MHFYPNCIINYLMAGTGSYISLYVSWDLAEHIHNIGGKRYYSIYMYKENCSRIKNYCSISAIF